jgi:hypothetical protein
VINSGGILMDRHGDIFVQRRGTYRILVGNSSNLTYNSGDKFRYKFNRKARGNFAVEEMYVQDFGGKIINPYMLFRDKSNINLNGRPWDHFGVEESYILEFVGKFLTPYMLFM